MYIFCIYFYYNLILYNRELVYYIFYDEYRRRTHRKKTADDKGKESNMVSEAKPGILSMDRIRAVDAAAYRRRIEAETPAQYQAGLEMQPLIVERQTPIQAEARR
ncbi:hypothetical protein AVEN_30851-1 [Araneus ventricosus]|uniref:Uncharacterized protein n=1 Tax=Araneus ventricosus TaxID=182803 RepID=A0A4Y2Q321_ARAVE|nr:hypothetical protein AVEN_30851-1 [Araneus ventricosus]